MDLSKVQKNLRVVQALAQQIQREFADDRFVRAAGRDLEDLAVGVKQVLRRLRRGRGYSEDLLVLLTDLADYVDRHLPEFWEARELYDLEDEIDDMKSVVRKREDVKIALDVVLNLSKILVDIGESILDRARGDLGAF